MPIEPCHAIRAVRGPRRRREIEVTAPFPARRAAPAVDGRARRAGFEEGKTTKLFCSLCSPRSISKWLARRAALARPRGASHPEME